MAKFQEEFNTVRRWRTAEEWIVIIAAVFLVAEFVIMRVTTLSRLVSLLQIATCLLAVGAVVCTIVSDFLLYQAEEDKRTDLLDNAFGSHLAENESSGYYNNDTLPKGLNKLAMNNFESSFFTYRIMRSGLLAQGSILTVVLIAYLLVSLTASRDVMILLIQLALPLDAIVNAVRYFSTYSRVKSIYHSYRRVYDSSKEPRSVDLIANILSYTAALAYGKTLLSQKHYLKMNTSLSAEWENYCKTILST